MCFRRKIQRRKSILNLIYTEELINSLNSISSLLFSCYNYLTYHKSFLNSSKERS